jgi:hypothetical protein
VASLGDFLAQTVIERRGLELRRNAVIAGYGFTETLLEGHFWYGFLERLFGSKMTYRVALMKMATDQLLFSPLEVSSFMIWAHLIEGQKEPPLLQKLQWDFPPTMLVSYLFWCPASLISFYLVPYPLRALYTCVMCVAWDTFMSYASHNIVKDTITLRGDTK